MTPETLIPLILSAANSLYDFLVKKQTVANSRKVDVSDFLSAIGNTLQRVADGFTTGQIPHGACAEMEHYSKHIQTVLHGILPDDMLQYYSGILVAANNIEMMIMATKDVSQIHELEKAAGVFRSASMLIRI